MEKETIDNWSLLLTEYPFVKEGMFAEDYWEQIIMDCSNIKITATGSMKKIVNSSRSYLVKSRED